MNVLILGGGGVIGHKLAAALIARGHLCGAEIARITLADLEPPAVIPTTGPSVLTVACDISDFAAVEACIDADTDVIFLLAAVVSGHAEAEFETGYRTNMMGMLNVLDRARALGTKPITVFTSSSAVFGGDVPDPITDVTATKPQTSYGTQKAIGELLLNDYSRKGFLDGRGFRLPTISVRPGAPNRAASSFMSSIIREPLSGRDAVCPVSEEFAAYYLSPRRCVENLIRGAELSEADLGESRSMIMPGRCWTIAEIVAAMTAVAGPAPAERIRWEPEPAVQTIVEGWRGDLRADRALSLGLVADDSFEDNVRFFLEDDLPHA